MTLQVKITKGIYRGLPVEGTFELIKPMQNGQRGSFITIRNPTPKIGTPEIQRITVKEGDFTIIDAAGNEIENHVVLEHTTSGEIIQSTQYETLFTSAETEEEALERIRDTFSMLDKLTDACSRGIIRGLIVSGPPGIGKSFGVEKQLKTENVFQTLKAEDPRFEIFSGVSGALGLYKKLHEHREQDHVLVLDDSDGVLFEEDSLSLLKAALNSGERRRVCWNFESRVLSQEGIPSAFDFEGSIIFLTNVDFERAITKQNRIAEHLAAILSRCHYLDLEISSTRDKILRIKQCIADGMLSNYNFTENQEALVINFIVENVDFLRETSLRMAKKIADFVKATPDSWYTFAESTCLYREAKFRRMYENKMKEKDITPEEEELSKFSGKLLLENN